jgi:hypothetical protein
MNIEQVPKHVPKNQLPGLKVGALVKTLRYDYSQAKNSFVTKPLPMGTVGRLKKVFDFGKRQKTHRFLCEVKFEGHPITTFYTEELVRIRI